MPTLKSPPAPSTFDPSVERPIPLLRVPKEVDWLPKRNGKRLHYSTLIRWSQRGLETIRIGGTLCTSAEALVRYFHRLSAGDTRVAARTPA